MYKFLTVGLMTLGLVNSLLGITFEEVEERIFSYNDDDQLEILQSIDLDMSYPEGKFEAALVYYRLGNLMTNADYNQKTIDILEEMLEQQTNVYIISYLGIAYATRAQLFGMLKQLTYSLKAMKYLDRAVEFYPDSYVPRLYRGMLYIFIPGLFGGDVDTGQQDMEFVIDLLPELEKDDEYKSFVYFMYGIYWGEKEKDYQNAVKYLTLSREYVTDDDFLEKLDERLLKYQSKME